jgi:hypothetical protein
LVEDVLKRSLRLSNAALAMEAAAVLNLTDADASQEHLDIPDENCRVRYENKTATCEGVAGAVPCCLLQPEYNSFCACFSSFFLGG